MSDSLMAVVDDQNALEGYCPRSRIHQPPFPIHQATTILLLGDDDMLLFQRRSIECPGYPNRYDVVGGHVKLHNAFSETAFSELHSEAPLTVSPERLRQLGGVPFFKVRTSQNNENKLVFLLRLVPAEQRQVSSANDRLHLLWFEVASRVAPKFGWTSVAGSPLEYLREVVCTRLRSARGRNLDTLSMPSSSNESRLQRRQVPPKRRGLSEWLVRWKSTSGCASKKRFACTTVSRSCLRMASVRWSTPCGMWLLRRRVIGSYFAERLTIEREVRVGSVSTWPGGPTTG